MIRHLEIAPLAADDVDLAYPLYRELAPGQSLVDWRELAARYHHAAASPAHGFIVARRGGYMRGLFSFELARGLASCTLMIDHVVVLDPVAPRDLAVGLHDYVLALAQRYDCDKGVVTLSAGSAWLHAEWQDADGSRRGKPLACVVRDAPVSRGEVQ